MRSASSVSVLALAFAMLCVSSDCFANDGPVEASSETRKAIEQTLAASVRAWNASDLDRFLSIYEDTPSTSIVGSGKVARGLAAIRGLYATFSPEPGANGTLSLDILSIVSLGENYALLTGRAHLVRTGAPDPGKSGPAKSNGSGAPESSGVLTSLTFHRTPHGWRLIHDHTG